MRFSARLFGLGILPKLLYVSADEEVSVSHAEARKGTTKIKMGKTKDGHHLSTPALMHELSCMGGTMVLG